MARPTAMCELASSSSISACVARSSSSGATTRLTRPMRSASCASIVRAVMISSLARPRPTTAGRRVEPPTSGMIPNLTSGRPKLESLEAIRRSQPSATSSAPPTQVRWIWQTTGFAISSQRLAQSRNTWRNGRSIPGVSEDSASSTRSTPAENTLPSPRSTTQCTAGSAAGLAQRVTERQQQLLVHRVALLRAVQHDVADRPEVLGQDDAHGVILL